MIDRIDKQISNINLSLNWLLQNQEEQYEQRFLQLVDERRKLKIIRNASSDNPAIAAFGRSQVGKSYLMNCILKDKDNPFMVKDGSGKQYEFVKQINPPGEGKEASGVVTRFSSFSRTPDLYDEQYPVLARLFSVADLIMIISDSYYNDTTNFTSLSDKDVDDLSRNLYEKYHNTPRISHPVLDADEILNIKAYFKKHINNAQTFINDRCTLFDRLSLIADRIPDNDYSEIFSNLWNKDPNLTRLFNHLLQDLRRLDFSQYIYMPIDSVLHDFIKENTIMSVNCLKLLFSDNNPHTTTVYLREGNSYRNTGTWKKSDVCAICKEVDFKISDNFLSSTSHYEMEAIPMETRNKLTDGEIQMAILKENDLLDFPGARSRLKTEVCNLSENDVVLDCFLRGKVAYLFKTYNDNLMINILLYCHHDEQNDVADLYLQLKDWVNNYVGDTPEKRSATIAKAGGSPLFYVATMFNKDMKERKDGSDNTNGLNNRWIGRFETVLYGQCFHIEEVQWVKNWAGKNNNFSNSYLLRDYKYSTIGESNLYNGFNETGRETSMIMDPNYYSLMRDTFINNKVVRNLFRDPALTWDVACTKNNDGALYIIEQLYCVSTNMNKTREEQFAEQYDSATSHVYNLMKDYYISDNKDELLNENIRKARQVHRELDFTCNFDNYYFGHLLQRLQMQESVCYNIVHQLINSGKLQVNNFEQYQIVFKHCEKMGYPLDPHKSNAENWKSLIAAYDFMDREDAERFLVRYGVNWEELFQSDFERNLPSFILADNVFDYWCKDITSSSFYNEFSGDGKDGKFFLDIMSKFTLNIVETAKFCKIPDMMAQRIADIVNVVAIGTANENLISDMLASTINDFVMDLGFSTLTEEQKAAVRRIGEERNLHIFDYICRDIPKKYDENDLTQLFNDMTTKSTMLVPSFEENYNKWTEYMIISFISHLEIPNYDHAANESLFKLLTDIKAT